MAFKDFTENLMAKAKRVNLFHRDGDNQRGAMPNGGTHGYYPGSEPADLFAENQAPAAEQPRQPEQPQPQNGPAMGAQQPYQQQAQQPQQPNDPLSAYTSSFGGFSGASWQYGTGRQQPVGNAQQPNTQQSWTSFNQPVNNAQQPNTQQSWTSFNPPVNNAQQPNAQQSWTSFNQPVNNAQQPNAQQSWTSFNQPVNNAQQPNAQQSWTSFNQPVNNAQQPNVQQSWTSFNQPVNNAQQEQEFPRGKRAGKRQQQEKITYMPNVGNNFVDESGSAYMHTERVVQLLSVAACFDVMGFMRNNESVVVNVENIANEAETQRCLDLLAGAAFTMDCSMTKITQFKHAYLIAPRTVLVLADDSVRSWETRDNVHEQREQQPQPQYRPVRGAYMPDRPDEQRRDMYQEQQERMQHGYTGRQQTYAQNGYTGRQQAYNGGYGR